MTSFAPELAGILLSLISLLEQMPLHAPMSEPPTFSTVSLVIENKVDEDPLLDASDHQSVVPFFSQFTDITNTFWKGKSCGIASLAMLIEYHNPGSLTSVDSLLEEGIREDAYITNVGWTYAGLIGISRKYGLNGTAHDLGEQDIDTAFLAFIDALSRGPVMASVHYTFVPTNVIPHLVIVTGIEADMLRYNDPAEPTGGGTVSVLQFKSAWKKRYIEFFPA